MKKIVTVVTSVLIVLAAVTLHAQVVKSAPGDKWQVGKKPAAPLPEVVGKIEDMMTAGDFANARYLAAKYIKSKSVAARDNVLFLMGKTRFYMDDYDGAVDTFAQLREEYGEGRFEREIAEFEFAIAVEYLKGRKRVFLRIFYFDAAEEGLTLMRLVAERVPFSLRAQQAIMKMADYYVGAERYDEARQEYAFLLANYKNSKFAEDAEFGIAACLFRMNDGIPYDRDPLIESRDSLKLYLQKYPNGEYVRESVAMSEEITNILARKDLMVAEFYRRRGDTLASKFYYRMTVNGYPETEVTKMARLRARSVGHK